MNTTNYRSDNIVNKYSLKPLASTYIGYPAMLKTVGDIRGKKVLDFGCGSGWFSHKLSKKGATVSGIDNSPKWIKLCKSQKLESKKLKFFLSRGDNMKIFKGSNFDVIIANMVFLNMPSKAMLERSFREIGRTIKKGGTFIFSDIHPYTIIAPRTNIKVSSSMQGFSNFKEGFKFKSKHLLTNYKTIEFTDSHWSLGFYSRLLDKNGMVIEQLIEPQPVKMDPKKKLKDYKLPTYIIFKCRKI